MTFTEQQRRVLMAALSHYGTNVLLPPDELMTVANLLGDLLINKKEESQVMDWEDDEPKCTNPKGHSFVFSGTEYGGDDESYRGEGRCYCEWCGADGDA